MAHLGGVRGAECLIGIAEEEKGSGFVEQGTDAGIVAAMRLVWSRMKLVIEPSAAVGLAVVLTHAEQFRGKRVAVVFSGGNVDLDKLPW